LLPLKKVQIQPAITCWLLNTELWYLLYELYVEQICAWCIQFSPMPRTVFAV